MDDSAHSKKKKSICLQSNRKKESKGDKCLHGLMAERQSVHKLAATPRSRRQPCTHLYFWGCPWDPQAQHGGQGSLLQRESQTPPLQREVRINNNNNNSNKNNGQLLSPSDFRVCCGQNTAQTNPMTSASEPQVLFSGFVGPPPEILIPQPWG